MDLIYPKWTVFQSQMPSHTPVKKHNPTPPKNHWVYPSTDGGSNSSIDTSHTTTQEKSAIQKTELVLQKHNYKRQLLVEVKIKSHVNGSSIDKTG